MNQLAALFLGVVTLVQSFFGVKLPTSTIEQVKIFLVPTQTDLEIHLSGSNQRLSAVAIRLVYNFSKSGLKITPNPMLATNNWLFPVKKVDSKNGKTTFDLAAANVSTTGYSLGQDLLIAKINLPNANVTQFSFDQKETKIYTKDTKEVPLVF